MKGKAVEELVRGSETGNGENEADADYVLYRYYEAERLRSVLKTLLRAGMKTAECCGTPEAKGPPRFTIIYNGAEARTGSALGILEEIRNVGQKDLDIQRYKGLGEMNPDQLWETTMNPATRILYRVRLEDEGATDTIFSILMGSEVEARRRFIENHALEVKNLDI